MRFDALTEHQCDAVTLLAITGCWAVMLRQCQLHQCQQEDEEHVGLMLSRSVDDILDAHSLGCIAHLLAELHANSDDTKGDDRSANAHNN